VRLKQEKPSWGRRRSWSPGAEISGHPHRPAISTFHAVLVHGLAKRRKGSKNKAAGTVLTESRVANDLWCADYKGEFMLLERRSAAHHFRPASRYLFAVEALESTGKSGDWLLMIDVTAGSVQL